MTDATTDDVMISASQLQRHQLSSDSDESGV